MANHPAAPLLLRQGDRETLQRLVRSTSVRAGLAQRARIPAADEPVPIGVQTARIQNRTACRKEGRLRSIGCLERTAGARRRIDAVLGEDGDDSEA